MVEIEDLRRLVNTMIADRWFCVLLLGLLTLAMSSAAPSADLTLLSYDDSTPFPNALKCFTCDNKSSNYECNRKAYDMFCPRGTQFCHSSHHVDKNTGKVSITKKCAAAFECTPTTVGCVKTGISGVKRCVSCCDWNICNSESPSNITTAVFISRKPNSASTHMPSKTLCLLNILLTFLLCHIVERT